jgi:uncharacterized repeat protein (TIGR01451 family)
MKPNERLWWRLAISALVITSGPALAEGGVAILSPPDGDTKVADLCPFEVCTAGFTSQVEVTGDPVDSVEFEVTQLTGPRAGMVFTLPICNPPDPIEGTPGCPVPPVVISDGFFLWEGTGTVVARTRRGALEEVSTPIHLTVLPPLLTPPGTITLSSVAPLSGSPGILARDPGPAYPTGIATTPGETTITGSNLDNNPFLEVYVSPVVNGEPPLTAESGLPVADWCRFPARILDRGVNPGGESFLRVELPTLPLLAPTTCGAPPGLLGNIFDKRWRWMIRDGWIRPERIHDWWAIPTPQMLPWHDAPPFRMVKPSYPLIDGFGFANKETDPKYYEFLTVFGNNAYICLGAFGACLTHIPDPLYHLVWWPTYSLVIGGTGGSCNGMSATSLLMSREDLQTEPFSPDVHFPVGFDQPGDPARYSEPDWCTPFCSPPRPDNLWAHIRKNHGVQFSREFLLEVIETLGEAIFDPNDVASIRGVPQATLERVAGNPRENVVCFFAPGNGHCVTPFAVSGNRMLIYDNNKPQDTSLFIEIVDGDYNYPARTEEPHSGNAIMAFPIDIWKEGRHLFGVMELGALIGGGLVEFLVMVAVGAGDMTVTNEAGGRWGFEEDGSFTDSLLGAVSVPPLGPQGAPSRAMPLAVAMNQPAPTVQINATGGRYIWTVGAGGHLLQLEASDAAAGDQDLVHVLHPGGRLEGFDFTPHRAASHFVPRVGLVSGEQERALFHFHGLSVPGGKRVGFGADKQARAVTYENDTGATTHHSLALDYVAGAAESHGRMIYGPFEVPRGARHRVRLASWPEVTQVVSELDLDRDGTPEHTVVVVGRPLSTPLAGDTAADLSATKTASSESVALGASVIFTVELSNAGPDTASEVALIDSLPPDASISEVTASQGGCTTSPSGLRCAIGSLAPGDSVTVTYAVTAGLPGTLANGASVFAKESDPDLTNNNTFATVAVPALVDINPGRGPNLVTLGSRQVVLVALLGQPGLDVRLVDPSTLAFGPNGASAFCPQSESRSHRGQASEPGEECGKLTDANHDGSLDLVAHFRIDETGIADGDTQGCLRAAFADGRSLEGCDAILTRRAGAHGRR